VLFGGCRAPSRQPFFVARQLVEFFNLCELADGSSVFLQTSLADLLRRSYKKLVELFNGVEFRIWVLVEGRLDIPQDRRDLVRQRRSREPLFVAMVATKDRQGRSKRFPLRHPGKRELIR